MVPSVNAEALYRCLPSYGQHLACTIYGMREKRIRMGRPFRDYLSELTTNDYASEEFIAEYQNKKVYEVISKAYASSSYYRDLLNSRGLNPSDFRRRDDLGKLPILEKSEVFQSADRIRNWDIPRKSCIAVTTSGTTGTALSFPKTLDSIAYTWAVWWRHRSRFGFYPGAWHVNFTGKPVVHFNQRVPPFWRIDFARKQVIIPGTQLVPQKIPAIINFLQRREIRFFTGYPSLIAQFCAEVEELGLELQFKPTHVFPGAENVQQFQRDIISRATGALITDQYGFTEGCANASRCEAGHYHEDWEYGVLECGSPVKNADGSLTGEVLGTGFHNDAFPFVRYAVGDTATWASPDFKCPCGRKSRVLFQIDGRNEDYVITPEGNRVMRFDYLFKDTFGIKEAQIVQSQIGSIVIRYVARAKTADSDLAKVKAACAKYISPSLKVVFEQVPEIPRSGSGKFKPVLSLLDTDKLT